MKTYRTLIIGAFGLLSAIAITSCTTPGSSSAPATPAATSQANSDQATTTQPSTSQASASQASMQTSSAAVQVPLADDFNLSGIYPDGVPFSNGVDGDGFACPSNQLGTAQSWGGVKFDIASASPTNVVTCQGQTISLPAGTFSKLEMLAIGVNGAQADLNFTVHYSDDSTQAFTQSVSDWASPDSNTGEATAVTMNYRLQADGSHDDNTFYVYGYSFNLNSKNAVKSLQLPDNNDVKIFAITLVP